MKRIGAALFLFFLATAVSAQTELEDHFNLCLEFGAPMEVVQLFQSFRTYKEEMNGSMSYIVKEDNSLLKDKPYSEYQIWYTIDKDLGLYQSSLILRADNQVLQHTLTSYLKKFSFQYGEPVYTRLSNGSLLIFWYDEAVWTVKARLILDIVNPYKYVNITYCSPQPRHTRLLKTLYNSSDPNEEEQPSQNADPKPETEAGPAAADETGDDAPAEDETSVADETPAVGDETGDEAPAGDDAPTGDEAPAADEEPGEPQPGAADEG